MLISFWLGHGSHVILYTPVWHLLSITSIPVHYVKLSQYLNTFNSEADSINVIQLHPSLHKHIIEARHDIDHGAEGPYQSDAAYNTGRASKLLSASKTIPADSSAALSVDQATPFARWLDHWSADTTVPLVCPGQLEDVDHAS